jgi:hypothetical protein
LKHAQKPDHVSLNTLLQRIREGHFVIPDFQREFEWSAADIRGLMASIFQDFFIGSLLLWRGTRKNFESLSTEPIYGHPGGGTPVQIVLDGQQRLTAMHYAFHAPDKVLPGRQNRFIFSIDVARFIEEDFDNAFRQDWGNRWCRQILEVPERQFENHWFPLAIVGKGGFEIFRWAQGYESFWRSRAGKEPEAIRFAENGTRFIEHIKDIIEQYQISYIELDRDLEIEKVCDIFTQINSKGVRLDAFDLLNSLLKPKDIQLKLLYRSVVDRLEFAESDRMNIYVLMVMSILTQEYCSPKYLYYLVPGVPRTFRDPDGGRRDRVIIADSSAFLSRWNDAVQALEQALRLLRHPQEFGVTAGRFLPYASILPAFAAINARIGGLPAERQLQARRKLNRWYWASIFTNRYSSTVETRSTRDFIDLGRWFEDDDAIPPVIGEFESSFRRLDLERETRSSSAVYRAIFNLFVIGGARDWVSGTFPEPDAIDDHHVVPSSWGQANGVGPLIDSVLNRAPLKRETNRQWINDKLPNAYLPALIASSGEAAVRANLETHFISPTAFDILLRDPFTRADFETFIAERKRTILEAIEHLLVKARLDLSPSLRELDSEIERIELELRGLVVEAVDRHGAAFPEHIAAKVDERMEKDRRRGLLDTTEAEAETMRRVQYLDLRELESLITAKAAWPAFSARFGTREQLAARFGQLAELRNGIRHSRAVSEIARRDGEAAILWFKAQLDRAA